LVRGLAALQRCELADIIIPPYTTSLRLFLFQTAFPSGAPALPVPVDAFLGIESRKELPVFAINRGLGVVESGGPVCDTGAEVLLLSLSLADGAAPVATFAVKVLFTETDLKDMGFLTVEAERARPFESDFVASVSEPPLTLTSAELGCNVFSAESFGDLSASLLTSPFIWSAEAPPS
jgi:hypothetical protein